MQFTEKRHNDIVMLICFACFTLAQFALIYATGLYKSMYDSVEKLTVPVIVAGMIMLLAEVLLILIARIKKLDFLLRGFFLFKLIGVLAFVVCLFLRMGNQDITGNVFYYIYSVWTVYLRPASRLLQLLFGVSEFFRKALLLSIITYLSGVAFFGVKKQKRFEKEIAENKNRGKETDSV
jgi:hypothetical protein